MTKFTVFLAVFCFSHLEAQILPSALHSFEHLQWELSAAEVKEALRGKSVVEKELDISPPKGYSKIHFIYTDSLWDAVVPIVLMFSEDMSRLKSVGITFFGKNAATGEEIEGSEKTIEMLWEKFSDRFGKPQKDSNIPFMGKSRRWLLAGTNIQMMQATISGTKMLSVTYSEKSK